MSSRRPLLGLDTDFCDHAAPDLELLPDERGELLRRRAAGLECELLEGFAHLGSLQHRSELALHARTEEEVLYPAAILVGEAIRTRRQGR